MEKEMHSDLFGIIHIIIWSILKKYLNIKTSDFFLKHL